MAGESEISNSENVIDSREVEERIKFLEEEDDVDREDGSQDMEELKSLRALRENFDGVSWYDGLILVRGDYFTDYAAEYAWSIGAIGHNVKWPYNHINWNDAADELRHDFSPADFDGVEYWVQDY